VLDIAEIVAGSMITPNGADGAKEHGAAESEGAAPESAERPE